jgi:uncharacterized membrane-anchored protein
MTNRLVIAAALLALAQIGFLAWIIQGRAAILRNGQEILLKAEPVDPRDLLRGDYVRLGYEISSIQAALLVDAPAGPVSTGSGDIYVRLKKQEDGYWRAVGASLHRPQDTPPAPGEVDLRGVVSSGWSLEPTAAIHVDYGMERYYLPEGEGKAIEKDMRVRPFGILAAVGRDGAAQIKALMDGDTMLFQEPLY